MLSFSGNIIFSLPKLKGAEIRKLESTELEITLNPKIKQYDVKNKLYPKGRSTMGMPGTKVTKKKDKKWKHRG